jgi:ankyrin repeat protein
LASKKSIDRKDLIDVDVFVKNGVLHWKHERTTNCDRPDVSTLMKSSKDGQTAIGEEYNVITLMGIARDGPFEDFMTAWGQFEDCNDNSGGPTFVNLNRAVALKDVNFKGQSEVLQKLYKDGEEEIEEIIHEIETMKTSDNDGDWRTENIGATVAKRDEHLPVIWNAYAVICPGRTALHMAAANGQVDIVTAICHTPKVDFQAKDVFGYTPLHLACYSRSENKGEVITKLLEKQVNPNVAAKEKGFYFTALHLAVKTKSKHIVDMLLDWNPSGPNSGKVLDVGAKSSSGLTALHLAVKEAIAVKEALERNKKNLKKVKIKVKEDELNVERENLKVERKNLRVERANLVLMIVAIIRFMNNKSPEAINKSDKNKSTPLHTSVEAKDYRLVEILLEDGDKIDLELLDVKGRTALEIAVDKRDYPMVQKIQSYLERAGIVGNHKAYADSATAILVGAALLVTVTFAAWVQIPTNDSTLFWVFISLSFYFAVATFIAAAGAAIPSKGSTLGLVRRAVLASAFCIAISLACAVAAFATAGFIIVPTGIEHRRKVLATTVVGGSVCLFFLLAFIRKILRASGLFILWLDYSAQKQFHKHISEPLAVLAYGVKNMLGENIKKWYEENIKGWYTRHVTKFFEDQENQPGDEGSTSSHDGSQFTTHGSPSSSGNENCSLGNKKSGVPRSPEICLLV